MARNYARKQTAVWRSKEWTSLSWCEQWAYDMLMSQADISAAGVLPVTVKRWMGNASGITEDALRDALSTLEAKDYLVIDWDHEEILVRSFIRHDGGYTNGKRLPVILAAANAVLSPKLRAAIANELYRLGVSDGLSDAHSDSPRVVVTERTEIPQPETTTLKPGTMPHAATPPNAEDAIVNGWATAMKFPPPSRLANQVRAHVRQLLAEDFDRAHITAGIAVWQTKNLPVDRIPQIVHEVANGSHRTRASPRSTTNDKVGNTLQMAERLARDEQRQRREITA